MDTARITYRSWKKEERKLIRENVIFWKIVYETKVILIIYIILTTEITVRQKNDTNNLYYVHH